MNALKRKWVLGISFSMLLIMAVFTIVTGCSSSNTERSGIHQQESAEADAEDVKEFKEAVQYLKEGDTLSLFGIALGEVCDTDKVAITGESHWLPQGGYLLKTYKLRNDNRKENLHLFFVTPYWENSKKEKRFFSVTCCEGDFFGITVGKDMFEKIYDEGNIVMKDYNKKQSEISLQDIQRLIQESGTYHLRT